MLALFYKLALFYRKLEQKIEALIGEGGHCHDSKRWYYIESNSQTAPSGRVRKEADERTQGFE